MVKEAHILDQIVYWATFLFSIVVVGYLLVSLIQASAREDRAYLATPSFEGQAKTAVIETTQGSIKILFHRGRAPKTVENFVHLAQEDFYDQTRFHRVVKDFLIQGGDPNSQTDDRSTWGKGTPGYMIMEERNGEKFTRGDVAMANLGKQNTTGSQFFIFVGEEAPTLDGKYTIFAHVVEGIEVADKISQEPTDDGDFPIVPIAIEDVIVE